MEGVCDICSNKKVSIHLLINCKNCWSNSLPSLLSLIGIRYELSSSRAAPTVTLALGCRFVGVKWEVGPLWGCSRGHGRSVQG